MGLKTWFGLGIYETDSVEISNVLIVDYVMATFIVALSPCGLRMRCMGINVMAKIRLGWKDVRRPSYLRRDVSTRVFRWGEAAL